MAALLSYENSGNPPVFGEVPASVLLPCNLRRNPPVGDF